ncbi:MAG TPA: fibronectin type III domain-containing protein, partial [Actinoplanes sp.]|nr:fibronectin type III domain-containing protein [Actinoplanes sp.]
MARFRRLLLPAVLSLVVGAPMAISSAASAAGPGSGAVRFAMVPATPIGLRATVTNSSASLTWEQPRIGPRPDHFRVYDGDTVVARNTTTHVTVDGLGFLTSHTFRVTAVGANGAESPASAPITESIFIPGANPACLPVPTSPVRASALTSSGVSLAWDGVEPPRG